MSPERTYLGEDGLANYLIPSREQYVPLVELPESLNPYLLEYDIHISVKLMNSLPLGNVKSLPAYGLLLSSDTRGKHVVESSSGNTVFSMGLLAPLVGAKSVHAVASNDVSDGKLKLLRLAGVQVELRDGPICPDAHDPNSTIAIARDRGQQPGWTNPGQYDNTANPAAHEAITCPKMTNVKITCLYVHECSEAREQHIWLRSTACPHTCLVAARQRGAKRVMGGYGLIFAKFDTRSLGSDGVTCGWLPRIFLV